MNDSIQKYMVLGAARSGMASARLLRRFGYQVALVDDKPGSCFFEEIRELDALGVSFFPGGKIPEASWSEIETLVVSPGATSNHPLIRGAAKKNIPVIGELELAFRFAKAPILAISGTNGKTTTVHLAADILRSGGFACTAAGNVGLPLAQAVLDPAVNNQNGRIVAEVSTFQLETIKRFHPAGAVLLNITPDHLDRHGSMDAYRDLKYRITENQTSDDFLIVNEDDPLCLDLGKKTRARLLTFSMKNKVKRGAYLERGELYLNLEENISFMKAERIPIPGSHNIQNVLAASLGCAAFGVKPDAIREAIMNFKGVEHRLEFVSQDNGVQFYNDSKATNLDSLEKALSSFSVPIVLIAGGKDKGNDYRKLNDLIRDRVKFIVAMGEASSLIIKAWGESRPAVFAESMNDAVRKAARAASVGDVILFSPACSSFDAYQNYEHRGRVYKEEVRSFLARRN